MAFEPARESRSGAIVRGIVMATFVVLAQFTDQGIRAIKNSPQRASQTAEMAKTFGCEMKEIYWTLGQYDIVTIVEAPDEQSLMSFGLALGSAGNVRTQTLRAFNKAEFSALLAKLP
jgi:uncharacterized protein with GYD domain